MKEEVVGGKVGKEVGWEIKRVYYERKIKKVGCEKRLIKRLGNERSRSSW